MDITSKLVDLSIAKKLIIFVGSGISARAGLPTWGQLVERILKNNASEIEKSNAYLAALNGGVVTAAELLDKLSPYKKCIYQELERALKISSNDAIYQKIATISRKIITTNFDCLIEDNAKISNVITWDSNYNLSKLDDSEEFVFKIHGDIRRPDSCALFEDDYRKIYSDDGLNKFQFSKLVSLNSCLFIGFSFADDYVKKYFTDTLALYGDFKKNQYIITTRENNSYGLQPIILKDFTEVESYISNLSEKVKEKRLVHPVATPQKKVINVPSNATDSPPDIKYWVGRVDELSFISTQFKVIFITGIGGQGKSALASYYYKYIEHSGEFFLDWRDFKEEDYNFQEKLISMILRLNDELDEHDLVGRPIEELIELFFQSIKEKQALFIFDNIDRYIDLDKFSPAGDMGLFFRKALSTSHKSLFIFTCRPFIHCAATHFYQIRLEGLGIGDVKSLLCQYKINISKEKIDQVALRIHSITSGHPLWMNIIFAQATRGEAILNAFLDQLEGNRNLLSSESDVLSNQLIQEVWKTLKNSQKLVLRTLSESISPLSIDQIAEILSRHVNYKNTSKALKSLSNLNLIETKIGTAYELHPLVKAFIKSYYPKSEQTEFISILIDYFGKFVLLLKEKKQKVFSYEEAKKYSDIIELYINNADYERAISSVLEAIDSFVFSGHIEDAVRVSIKLLDNIFLENKSQSLKLFNAFFRQAIQLIIDYGNNNEAERFLAKFKELNNSRSMNHILYLSLEIYRNWFNGNNNEALKRGEEAEFLLEQAHFDDDYNALHDYSLALRDSNIEQNIDKALKFFSQGENINAICDNESFIEGKNGSFYGNIGRCLEKLGHTNEAINCYAKSYYTFLKSYDSNTQINLGYASFWMHEALSKEGRDKAHLYFRRRAYLIWKKFSPPLVNRNLTSVLSHKIMNRESVESLEDWQIEKFCTTWVSEHLGLKSAL